VRIVFGGFPADQSSGSNRSSDEPVLGGNEEIARSREQGPSLVNRYFISFFFAKNKRMLEAGVYLAA
jgi:hypothetical protein